MKSYQAKRGFTFVELMVVVAIIGILASVVYASFGDARTNARNKAMMAEFKEVQLALELYKSQNGSYPLPAAGCRSGAGELIALSDLCGSTPLIEGLAPDFIAELPSASDSARASGCQLRYRTDAAGTWYKYTASFCIANATVTSGGIYEDGALARCPSTCNPATYNYCNPANSVFYSSFAVYSLGGQCKN